MTKRPAVVYIPVGASVGGADVAIRLHDSSFMRFYRAGGALYWLFVDITTDRATQGSEGTL